METVWCADDAVNFWFCFAGLVPAYPIWSCHCLVPAYPIWSCHCSYHCKEHFKYNANWRYIWIVECFLFLFPDSQVYNIYCPSLGPVGPSRAPANIVERVCVHWLCAGDDQTGGVMAWRFGRLTSKTMQSHGVAIWGQIASYDHENPWHGGVMALWLAVRKPSMTLWKVLSAPGQTWVKSVLHGSFRKAQRGPHAEPCVNRLSGCRVTRALMCLHALQKSFR